MVPSSCMTIPILLAKLKNRCKSSSEKSGANPPPSIQPRFCTQSGSKYSSGTRLSSSSDAKTAIKNRLNGQGRDFYQAGLNWLVLRSNKCLNRFDDYMEQ
ncbi:hypothetical protein AVEN_36527-1 [Araneus ventricosus]|uniref:Uncharacterized protein n=1 Tax=Araneus ventricosus TaxID=182803 RepID=A0A4Y2WBH5_ARAVE|nr:hypothetical protein AVEN_36527-1 [Araneus ventricosus]